MYLQKYHNQQREDIHIPEKRIIRKRNSHLRFFLSPLNRTLTLRLIRSGVSSMISSSSSDSPVSGSVIFSVLARLAHSFSLKLR